MNWSKKNWSAWWKHFSSSWWLGAIIILIIALLMRVPSFGAIPRGLNRDEASLGYNAYSLWKTGADEWGQHLPLAIRSFGDQKLPGYVYTLIPFVALFGLESWVIRLPSLIAGLLNVVLIGQVMLALIPAKTFATKHAKWLSWLAMLVLALSPWAIHFSRVAYETNLALSFFLAGLCTGLQALKRSEADQRPWLLATAILLSLTLFTYHSFQVAVPLIGLAAFVIFRRQLANLDRRGIFQIGLVILLTILLFVQGGLLQANAVKGNGLMALAPVNLAHAVDQMRPALPLPAPATKLLINKATMAVATLSTNLVKVWSPDWLFVTGSNHPDHNPGHMNNLPLWFAPFVLLGFVWIWRHRTDSKAQLLVAWLFIASLVPALTITPQHTTRATLFFPALTILGTFGLAEIWQALPTPWQTGKWWHRKLHQQLGILVVLIVGTLLILNSANFLWQYTNTLTRLDPQGRHDSYHQLAQLLAKYQPQSFEVITQAPRTSPYIWYLVTTQYDPAQYQQDRQTYPVDEEGFEHIKAVGNVMFQQINWDDVLKQAQSGLVTLVLKPAEIPTEIRTDSRYDWKENTYDEDGQVTYEVWQVKNENQE